MDPRSRRRRRHAVLGDRFGDLALVVLLATATVAGVAWADAPAVRALVSLPLLAVLPGYAFVAFSAAGGDAPSGAGLLRRGAAVVGTSLLSSSAIGVGLELAPVATTLLAVAVGAAGVTVALAVAAIVRRHRRAEAGAHGTGGALGGESIPAGHLAVGVLTALLAVAVVAHAAVAPAPAGFTEFYLLVPGEDGPTATDDLAFVPGEPATYVLGIENRERTHESYTVVAQLQTLEDGTVTDRRELERFSTTLAPGEAWNVTHSFEPARTDERLRLVYLLYRGSAPPGPTRADAYRALDVPGEVLSICHPDVVAQQPGDVLCPT